ncbi:MAG: protein kinase [Gemmatimonadetes bacterium]|nr:protein kinase [Gemmatimonadota bacterium]
MTDLSARLNAGLAGRYTIERELGRGGMAVVYLARELRHDRQVALKVLRPELQGPGAEPDRFLREIRMSAGLTHPHILPLHDSGECDGLLYYVMPLVGASLRQRLREEQRLPVAGPVRIARTVAAAIDYAHRHGVVHRDLKPENILLHDGQPLVADFGVAKALTACCDELTLRGMAIGTPAYMSPEQATGDGSVDQRSDIYSLGCMLFEMLCGHPPFSGETSVSVMAQQAVKTPPAVRMLRADVPGGVAEAVARALAKDPAHRYATALDFAAALESGLAATPAASATARRQMIAVLPFVNASPDPDAEYLSDGITDELINALARLEGLQVTSRTSAFAFKGKQLDVRSIGAQLNASAVLEGTVRKAGSRLRVTAQLSSTADGTLLCSHRFDRELKDVFAIQDEIAQTMVSTLKKVLLADTGPVAPPRYTQNERAYHLYLRGRHHWNRRNREGVAEAIRYFEETIAADPSYAPAFTGLADSYALELDYRSAPVAEGMERAKQQARRALELDETLAEAHTSLGWVTFIYDWDWEAAGSEFRRAIELNPSYATAHQWYAFLHAAHGRFDEAVGEVLLAADLDPMSASIRRSVGWALYYARRADQALDHLRRAATMDPTSGETFRILGLVHLLLGNDTQAEAAFREAIPLSGHADYAVAGLAHLDARRGRTTAAREALETLRREAETRYVSPVAFATIHAGLSDADATFHALEQCYRERRGWMAYLKVQPVLDPLRNDPRFAPWLRRMRLD